MEIKNHFGVYGVCLQDGKLLCIEKTRGPYQHRFDLPGGSQEAGEGLTETCVIVYVIFSWGQGQSPMLRLKRTVPKI